MASPHVTVLMSVFNGEDFLAEAVESILAQTFRDFEFLIIDDGSSDGTPEILSRYASRDTRVQTFHQQNKGVIASLNEGLRLARGDYIARMDADDIAFACRLEKQFKFMECHSDVG